MEDKSLDVDDKSNSAEATCAGHYREKSRLLGPAEEMVSTVSEADSKHLIKSKLGRSSGIDVETVTEAKEQPEPLNASRRKRKLAMPNKVSNILTCSYLCYIICL